MIKLLSISLLLTILCLTSACKPDPTGNPYEYKDDSSTDDSTGNDSNSDSSTEDNNDGDGSGDDDNDDNISNTSIAVLKSLYKGSTTRIKTTLSITGKVVANDIRGEFENVIVIDDGYDGIQISVANDPLFYNYPLGSTIVCQCEGLYLGSDYGVLRLGAESIFDDKVVSDIEGNMLYRISVDKSSSTAIPMCVNISDLTNRMVSRYVRFEKLMFKDSGRIFCDINEHQQNLSTTHTLLDEWGNEISLYIPSSVEYARMLTPEGWFSINVILESGSKPYKARPSCFEFY